MIFDISLRCLLVDLNFLFLWNMHFSIYLSTMANDRSMHSCESPRFVCVLCIFNQYGLRWTITIPMYFSIESKVFFPHYFVFYSDFVRLTFVQHFRFPIHSVLFEHIFRVFCKSQFVSDSSADIFGALKKVVVMNEQILPRHRRVWEFTTLSMLVDTYACMHVCVCVLFPAYTGPYSHLIKLELKWFL